MKNVQQDILLVLLGILREKGLIPERMHQQTEAVILKERQFFNWYDMDDAHVFTVDTGKENMGLQHNGDRRTIKEKGDLPYIKTMDVSQSLGGG